MELTEFDKSAPNYSSLDMVSFSDPVDLGTYTTPLPIKLACGEHIEYGPLFAYLFRRFGYPNYGWDDYKELAKYILSTPLPDMVLKIVPYCGNSSDISFSFFITSEAQRKIRNYELRDVLLWQQRMFDWVESNNKLPGWLDNAMEYYKTQGLQFDSWRDAWDELATLHWNRQKPGKKPVALGYLWRRRIERAYSKVEAAPRPHYKRSYDWREWPDEDLAKAYNQAAYEALLDLKRPVEVQDIFIDAFGRVEDPGEMDILDGSTSAGYPSGDLGNFDPKLFSEIHSLICKLGGGNAKKGMEKALDVLKNAENIQIEGEAEPRD